jgi:ribonuclease HI
MSKKKQKYYVVWEGHNPGVYDSWDKCQRQIKEFPGAKYKSFKTKEKALQAYKEPYSLHIGTNSTIKKASSPPIDAEIRWDSISVDAACSGKTGDMEYRGVHTTTGEEVFRQGPFRKGTNNVGEFLALVHALAHLKNTGNPDFPIYSDSRTAMSWVRNKKVKTTLAPTPANKKLFVLMDRAIAWLKSNRYSNPILKWDTENWGEIPADFGRK